MEEPHHREPFLLCVHSLSVQLSTRLLDYVGVRCAPLKLLENAAFEEYYRHQLIAADGEDFQSFLQVLQHPLPSVFRITESGRHFDYVRRVVENDLAEMRSKAGCEGDDDANPPIARIPWYHDGFAYKITADRSFIRNDASMSHLHKFLIAHNRVGSINRQEEVSMVPVCLLDLRPHHAVLDLCAAPGSKTAQIIDKIMAVDSRRQRSSSTSTAASASKPAPKRNREDAEKHSSRGVVVANDADLKRCWMLTHQLKRFGCAQLIITNHEAQTFPRIIPFDRVLCDVPCTGDGTLRKLVDGWRKWSPETALRLHRLQVDIAWRGLELLTPGGRMVYSTCSFNPLENEAVVAEMLQRGEGRVQLDCSPSGGWFSSFEDVPLKRRRTVKRSMFPPRSDIAMHLHKCLRILPQDQNSGGFFIAVLEKLAEVRGVDDECGNAHAGEAQQEADMEIEGDNPHEEELWGGAKLIAHDPLVNFVEQDPHRTVDSVERSLGFEGGSVRADLMIRSSDRERAKKVYLVYERVRALLASSLGRKGVDASNTLRYLLPHMLTSQNLVQLWRRPRAWSTSAGVDSESVLKSVWTPFPLHAFVAYHVQGRAVFAGVRVFEKDSRKGAPCDYRLTLEGLHLLLPHIRRQLVEVSSEDFQLLLCQETTRLGSLHSTKTNREFAACDVGTVAVVEESTNQRESLVVLKGSEKLMLMVPRELLGILRATHGVHGEDSTDVDHLLEPNETQTSGEGVMNGLSLNEEGEGG